MTLDANAVDAAAELGRQAAAEQYIDPYALTRATSLVVRTARDGEHLDTLDLERHLDAPRRQRGGVMLTDPADFVAYVTRLAGPQTVVFADETDARLTAVFNDHGADGATGWRDHRATLALAHDPDWNAWATRSGKLGTQTDFAEFVEDSTHTIVEPDAATMLEIATTFQAHRQASFSRGTRLASGDVQLAYSEDTTASAGSGGRIEVPERFTIRVAPFTGATMQTCYARLRYRIKDGALTIGYVLHRPDQAVAAAFAEVLALVASGLDERDVPVLRGTAPPVIGREVTP